MSTKNKVTSKEEEEETVVGNQSPPYSTASPAYVVSEHDMVDGDWTPPEEEEEAAVMDATLREIPEVQQEEHPRFVLVQKQILENMNLETLCALYGKLEVDERRPTFIDYELEVKFGTKKLEGVKRFTRTDYENVVKRLVSSGFTLVNNSGQHLLRIRTEGSHVRTEIQGLFAIEKYCKSNEIKDIVNGVKHVNKFYAEVVDTPSATKGVRVRPLDFDDFNFRVSLQKESTLGHRSSETYVRDWRNKKKFFRLLNRVSFTSPDELFRVEVSIVKMGTNHKVGVFTLDESNVLDAPETYEIEIEVNNDAFRRMSSSVHLPNTLRQMIKLVLSGLQQTNYPVSISRQRQVLQEYAKVVYTNGNGELDKRVLHAQTGRFEPSGRFFLGPNAVTLQLQNIAPEDANSRIPNVRRGFAVTDKADGEHHLLFVSSNGEIFLLDTQLNVKFTGTRTADKSVLNCILDGELIVRDKEGNFLNLFAAFDVYFYHNVDVRKNIFLKTEEEQATEEEERKKKRKAKSKEEEIADIPRYALLQIVCQVLETIVPVTAPLQDTQQKLPEGALVSALNSPFHVTTKKFVSHNSIFDSCKEVLEESAHHLPYEVDGLIFTHAKFGVGASAEKTACNKFKTTWDYSFKWKPPQYNTIDFLVYTVKDPNGHDVVRNIFEQGVNGRQVVQQTVYKMLILNCGYKRSVDGYLNPCRDVLDGRIPNASSEKEEDYHPERFYPTDPYDENAGLTNILLCPDSTGAMQMFTMDGKEVIEDKMIVEFSYDDTKDAGYRWIPLRIRHDKTAKYRLREREYGNSYKVCNDIWKSIQPAGRVTEEMLRTGEGIPTINIREDIYYNVPTVTDRQYQTKAMKEFHNLYVKRKLILGVTSAGETLIDLAVGKAGDLPKWTSAELSFVLGIDIARDNLENRKDGACARFLNTKKTTKSMPYCIFLHGNCAYNVSDGSGIIDEVGKDVVQVLLHGKDLTNVGDAVRKYKGVGGGGFHVASCQFALHYFFKNKETLIGFLENVAENTKKDGYFVGTCYDGERVFDLLSTTATGKSILLKGDNDCKIWEIQKRYTASEFLPNASCLGYEVQVYQESINQYLSEYLVHFGYLDRLLALYGFERVSLEEATAKGLPGAVNSFQALYSQMMASMHDKPEEVRYYETASKMTENEKRVSFLNNYFVYKKVRVVDIRKVRVEDDSQDIEQKNKQWSEIQIETEEVEPASPLPKATKKKRVATKKKEKAPAVRVLGKITLEGDKAPSTGKEEEVVELEIEATSTEDAIEGAKEWAKGK